MQDVAEDDLLDVDFDAFGHFDFLHIIDYDAIFDEDERTRSHIIEEVVDSLLVCLV